MLHHSFFRRGLALVLAAALALPTVYAASGDTILESDYEITEGLTYTNLVTDGTGGRGEAFILTLDANSSVFPITVQSSGTIYGAATIAKAIEVGESMGYNVIAAINSDYYSTSTGVPLGMVVEDGAYLSSPDDFPAIAFVDGQPQFLESPDVELILHNETTGESTSVHHLNKFRTASGGLYLLNENFSTTSTRTTSEGWMVRMEETTDDQLLTLNGYVTLTVTDVGVTEGSAVIGEGNYILTADALDGLGEVMESFSVGDEITLQTTCSDSTFWDAQWVSGAGDMMIENGVVTDSANWEHAEEGRAPRTAVGIKEDGSTVYYVSDGRQSGYAAGLTQSELADEMLALGCVWAINLDGGGSSIVSATLPGDISPTIQNSPSDGTPRSGATFILLVTEDDSDGTPSRLALQNDGAALLTGTSLTLDGVVAVDEYGTTVETDLDDLLFSVDKYGSMDGNVFTAGSSTGTATVTIYSPDWDIAGTAQIHVVNSLTDFTVTRADSTTSLAALYLKAGETVQLDVSGQYWLRDALYSFEGVTWETGGIATIDENGLLTPLGGEGTITATAGGLSHSIELALSHTYADVPSDHWSYNYVAYCYANSLMTGISTTEFGLGMSIKRGDFVLVLYNALGQPAVSGYTAYSDVSNTDYYAAAISWAAEQGIASGMGDGTFGAQTAITREQAFTMLGRALNVLGLDLEAGELAVLQHFSDYEQVASYAQQPTATLVTHCLVSGSNGLINPTGSLSREEMATLMERFLTYDADEVTQLTPPEVAPTGMSLSHTDLVLLYEETLQLTPVFTPTGSSATVTWTSSDTSIATVAEDGTVTNVYDGIGQPSVIITATVDNLVASCTVRCRPVGDDGITEDDTITFPTVTTPTDTDDTTDTDTSTDTTTPTGIGTGVVIDADSGLNVRTGPGSSFTISTKLANGTTVTILDNSLDGWYQITGLDQNGTTTTGYVSSSYIQLEGTLAEPAPEPEPEPEPESEPEPDVQVTTSSTLPGTVIEASTLNVRSTASTDGTILGKLSLGATVSIHSIQSGWCQVTATSTEGIQLTGYVSADYIALPDRYLVTNASSLNVRSGGGSTYDLVGKLAEGDIVYVITTADGWSQIVYQIDGVYSWGYVSADYLTLFP